MCGVCGLTNIKQVGMLYTWSNKHGGADRFFSKINRIMANVE